MVRESIENLYLYVHYLQGTEDPQPSFDNCQKSGTDEKPVIVRIYSVSKTYLFRIVSICCGSILFHVCCFFRLRSLSAYSYIIKSIPHSH